MHKVINNNYNLFPNVFRHFPDSCEEVCVFTLDELEIFEALDDGDRRFLDENFAAGALLRRFALEQPIVLQVGPFDG